MGEEGWDILGSWFLQGNDDLELIYFIFVSPAVFFSLGIHGLGRRVHG